MKKYLPVVHSYVEFGKGQIPAISAAVASGEDMPEQRVGTLGMANMNGQEVAMGALDEWLEKNDRTPMYAEHWPKTVPGGMWTDLKLEFGRELSARPVITPETSLGNDIKAGLKAGIIKGISWTVSAQSYDSWDFRDREDDEPGFQGTDDVMVLYAGNLTEISVVYYPADLNAGFYESEDEDKPRNSVESLFVRFVERDQTLRSARHSVISDLFEKRN